MEMNEFKQCLRNLVIISTINIQFNFSMKKSFLFAFLLLIIGWTPIAAQTTFEVCEVEVAENLLPERDYQEVLEAQMVNNRSIIAEADRYRTDLKRELWTFPQRSNTLVRSGTHPFATAIYMAYAEHRPLTFSPDMVWMLICQGFAKHIDLNGEALRHYFVQHKGKKNITIERPYLMKNSVGYWESMLGDFSTAIESHVGEKLHGLVANRFSTTSSVEATAFEVTLMDAMSSYFSYRASVTCGIPSVTLEGTVADWEKLERDFEQLAEYDLEWWVNDLMPILHEFTQAAKGEADPLFWGKIYDYLHFEGGMCGSPEGTVTGWMMKFFPYLNDDSKNPLIGVEMSSLIKHRKGGAISPKSYRGPILSISDLPMGVSKADFVLNNNGELYKMEFLSGFVGITQDATTKALRPEINWGVVDSGRKPTAEELAEKNGTSGE